MAPGHSERARAASSGERCEPQALAIYSYGWSRSSQLDFKAGEVRTEQTERGFLIIRVPVRVPVQYYIYNNIL